MRSVTLMRFQAQVPRNLRMFRCSWLGLQILTGAKRREWMGMGVAGSYYMLLLVIMDHSRKFPAFSSSKNMFKRKCHPYFGWVEMSCWDGFDSPVSWSIS